MQGFPLIDGVTDVFLDSLPLQAIQTTMALQMPGDGRYSASASRHYTPLKEFNCQFTQNIFRRWLARSRAGTWVLARTSIFRLPRRCIWGNIDVRCHTSFGRRPDCKRLSPTEKHVAISAYTLVSPCKIRKQLTTPYCCHPSRLKGIQQCTLWVSVNNRSTQCREHHSTNHTLHRVIWIELISVPKCYPGQRPRYVPELFFKLSRTISIHIGHLAPAGVPHGGRRGSAVRCPRVSGRRPIPADGGSVMPPAAPAAPPPVRGR